MRQRDQVGGMGAGPVRVSLEREERATGMPVGQPSTGGHVPEVTPEPGGPAGIVPVAMLHLDTDDVSSEIGSHRSGMLRVLRPALLLLLKETGASAIVIVLGGHDGVDPAFPGVMVGDPALSTALQVLGRTTIGRSMGNERPQHGALAEMALTGQISAVRATEGATLALRDESGAVCGAIAMELPRGGAEQALEEARNEIEMIASIVGNWPILAELERELETSQKRNLRLARLSQLDALTGLDNSASFAGKVKELLLAEGEGRTMAFVLIDIDHFKTVNDLYGHQFGDLLLKTVARAIVDSFAWDAVVGRLGGDEFGVLLELPSHNEKFLRATLSRCRNTILRATAYLNKPDLGRVSMGAAIFPDQAEGYDTLYRRADLALYASKSSGRGSFNLFSEAIGDRFDYVELSRSFREACENGQVVPYFQPMADPVSGVVQAYEVLCRWDHPKHGLLSPQDFSSVFADHTLATVLTRHMVNSSLVHFANKLSSSNGAFKISVNMTYFDLMDREFVFEFQAALAKCGLTWDQVIVEVQETVVLGETSGQIFRSLEEIRRRGAEIALDDFGTGYGGLRHLKNWPVDILKIDKSFVKDLCSDFRDQAIVSSIVTLSRDLGFKVVAEGVETAGQIELLRKMGCDFAQGYAFGKPQAPLRFETGFGDDKDQTSPPGSF